MADIMSRVIYGTLGQLVSQVIPFPGPLKLDPLSHHHGFYNVVLGNGPVNINACTMKAVLSIIVEWLCMSLLCTCVRLAHSGKSFH